MADVRLPVIVGPTAAGKSRIALTLARESGAWIVSADSRQIYRGFDIGTAKPSPNEMADVPHAGIDVADPGERYSARRFADLARGVLARAMEQGRPCLVVGGTGFYIKALVQPLATLPELDPARRAALGGYLSRLDTATLRRWCERLDPARSRLGRTQLLRAIEVALLTGEPLSRQFARPEANDTAGIAARYLLVDPGPSLAQRIERRVDDMLRLGWLDEVRRLARDVPADAPAWNATGYETLRRYVGEGAAGYLEAARQRVIVATRQYAKRQRTWFRHQLRGDMQTLHPDEQGALDRARAWWREESR